MNEGLVIGQLKCLVTFLFMFAISLFAGISLAAPPDVPPAPVAVNIPPARPVDARLPEGGGPATISADTPRTGPPPVGQTVPEDYRIGPQDLIEIQVYGIEGLRREVRVNSRGVISLALIGAVNLGGLTAQEAEELLTAKYEKDYLRNPQVSVFIKEFTSQRITVEGAVGHPGIFPIKGQTSLLQAIAMAGGGAAMSDMTEVLVFRVENGAKKMVKHDVVKIRTGELPDPVLMNDDLVVVNRSAARAALKDSLFRDILETLNPFSYMKP
jgi:polysaccharide biosynthesis/export protein